MESSGFSKLKDGIGGQCVAGDYTVRFRPSPAVPWSDWVFHLTLSGFGATPLTCVDDKLRAISLGGWYSPLNASVASTGVRKLARIELIDASGRVVKCDGAPSGRLTREVAIPRSVEPETALRLEQL